MLATNFLVFDSKVARKSADAGLIYCPSKGAKVQWPKTGRRGRPKKDPKDNGRLLKSRPEEIESPSKERYGFVDCNGWQPNDSSTRKFIRTHVMQNYRRQKRATNVKPVLQSPLARQEDTETVIFELKCSTILLLDRWGTDPFDCFPIKMEPYMHELLHFYISAFADNIYPIETFFGFNPIKKFWVPLALTDPALLNCILYGGDQYGAMLNNRKERPSAVNHLNKAIELLNERLHDPSYEVTDSTIAVAAGLAMGEQICGNQENWRIHVQGVIRMVDMRGGLLALESNPVLYDKLCRMDMCGSVPNLSKPCINFNHRKVQPNLRLGCDETQRTIATGFQAIHDEYGINPEFLGILYKVHTITRGINIANPPKSEAISMKLVQRIRSVQYHILSREDYDNIDKSRDLPRKACNLGILLYLCIIQNDFWVTSMSEKMIWQLKSCLQRDNFAAESMLAMRLWLSFLAGSVTFDPIEKLWFVCSIAEAISQLSLSDWSDAKLLLESFAWVGKLQDKSGRILWDEAIRVVELNRCDTQGTFPY